MGKSVKLTKEETELVCHALRSLKDVYNREMEYDHRCSNMGSRSLNRERVVEIDKLTDKLILSY